MTIKERINHAAEKYQGFNPEEYVGGIPTEKQHLSDTILDKFIGELEDIMYDNLYETIFGEEYLIQFIGMSRTAAGYMEAYFAISWISKDLNIQMCTVKLKSASIDGMP